MKVKGSKTVGRCFIAFIFIHFIFIYLFLFCFLRIVLWIIRTKVKTRWSLLMCSSLSSSSDLGCRLPWLWSVVPFQSETFLSLSLRSNLIRSHQISSVKSFEMLVTCLMSTTSLDVLTRERFQVLIITPVNKDFNWTNCVQTHVTDVL